MSAANRRLDREIYQLNEYRGVSQLVVEGNIIKLLLHCRWPCVIHILDNHPFRAPIIEFQGEEITFTEWSAATLLIEVVIYLSVRACNYPLHEKGNNKPMELPDDIFETLPSLLIPLDIGQRFDDLTDVSSRELNA